jgi:hypothetical protein
MTALLPRVALVAVAALLVPAVEACGFHVQLRQCESLFQTPPQAPASDEQVVVVEDGTVSVTNGVACASTPKAAQYVSVTGAKALPRGRRRRPSSSPGGRPGTPAARTITSAASAPSSAGSPSATAR